MCGSDYEAEKVYFKKALVIFVLDIKVVLHGSDIVFEMTPSPFNGIQVGRLRRPTHGFDIIIIKELSRETSSMRWSIVLY